MKNWLTLIFCLFIFGCATAQKMNSLSLGMSKDEVIRAMGTPTSTSATGGVEYLNYFLFDTTDNAFRAQGTTYFVRIINGRVDAFGRAGDFDSTRVPETKSIIDLNINDKQKP